MHFSAIATVAASIVGAFVVNEAPLFGYGVEAIEWKVEVTPGNFQLFKGTAEEVHAQALAINPDFMPTSTPQARGLKDKRSWTACDGYDAAKKNAIRDGAAYLRNLPPGHPTNGPGPNNCGRISCSHNSAIWWCNDSTSTKSIDGWDWIANSAERITQVCDPGSDKVSGRNHEDGDWSTIIRGARC